MIASDRMPRVPGMRGVVVVLALFALAPMRAEADAIVVPEPTLVSFPAADGIQVSADLYVASPKTAAFVILYHQAGWSRGEYREIAPRLATMGLNVLAVDQRSGGKVRGVVNLTHARAVAAGKTTDYVDALPDMQAAIDYARAEHARGKLILWGSSYSSALVLRLAARPANHIDAVLSFSPGEYFARFGKPKDWIRQAARTLQQPVFITSARNERRQWQAIYASIPSPKKRSYVPRGAGQHGSRALWTRFADAPGYWAAVQTFLDDVRR